jgi:hypothetical protein
MAQAIRTGYPDLFTRNESAHKLDRKGLEGLVIQSTGLDQAAPTLRAIVGTFESLKAFADFDAASTIAPEKKKKEESEHKKERDHNAGDDRETALNLSYNINLNLPKSDDPAVFNAIFKALREHLLRSS